METYKGDFGDKQFYFKPQKDGVSYVVEPYQMKGFKGFKMIQRPDGDVSAAEGRKEWLISPVDGLPEWVIALEGDLSDYIQKKSGHLL
ncbi:MAG TPA: hypothetical protein VEB40_12165 [Flavipsychrobacter sp.]|nr:hypothetical protein [Flavipsychrobacter sp.]